MEYKDYPDQQLVDGAGTGAAVQWIPIEMMRRLKDSVNNLNDSVNTLSKTSSRESHIIIRLTWGIVGLTVIMLFGLAIQIWIAWKK